MDADNNELVFKSTGLPNRSFSRFEFMKQKREFCDINFKIGDQTIAAHRVVLAAGIPYLHEMLSREGMKPDENEIDMPDVEPNAWQSLIEYAYTGEIKINLENVKQLLSAACLLCVEDVKLACCKFWAEHMRFDNAVSIQEFAASHDCTELAEKAGIFIRENFERISVTEAFLEMPFSYIRHLLSADDIKVAEEENVFEAVMRWIKKDPENRKQYLYKILSKVRLPLLKPDYLRRVVLEEELIHLSIPCRDLITEARDYHTLPEAEKVSCSFSSKPRNFNRNDGRTDQNANVICIISTELSLTVDYFNTSTEALGMKKRQLYPTDGGILVSVNRELYYFYGTSVLVCTPPDYEWKSCSRRYLRHFASSATLGNEIYICGGVNGDAPCNVVECFDTKSREWSIVANMNVSRMFSSAAALQGYLYIMGGMNGCSVLNSAERYSPLTKIWTAVAPMLDKRWKFGCTALNDKIYAVGGMVSAAEEKCVSTAEVYNSPANQWAFISPMSISRWSFPVIPYEGKLYVIGGKDDLCRHINVMEIYDPEADEWKFGTLPCLQFPISDAVVISPPVS